MVQGVAIALPSLAFQVSGGIHTWTMWRGTGVEIEAEQAAQISYLDLRSTKDFREISDPENFRNWATEFISDLIRHLG
jgi:hypothetical protein